MAFSDDTVDDRGFVMGAFNLVAGVNVDISIRPVLVWMGKGWKKTAGTDLCSDVL